MIAKENLNIFKIEKADRIAALVIHIHRGIVKQANTEAKEKELIDIAKQK